MLFQHVKSSQQFVDLWVKRVQPAIAKITGTYRPIKPTECAVNISNASRMDESPSSLETEDDPSEPPAKRQRMERLDTSISKDAIISEKYIGMIMSLQVVNKPQSKQHSSIAGLAQQCGPDGPWPQYL